MSTVVKKVIFFGSLKREFRGSTYCILGEKSYVYGYTLVN